jgi:hypothetical protein
LWNAATAEQQLLQGYYADAAAIVVCYAVCCRPTFDHVTDHLMTASIVSRQNPRSTSRPMLFVCGNSDDNVGTSTGHPSVIDGTSHRVDRQTTADISCRLTAAELRQMVDRIRTEFRDVVGTYTVSCNTGDGIRELFNDIAHYAATDSWRLQRDVMGNDPSTSEMHGSRCNSQCCSCSI